MNPEKISNGKMNWTAYAPELVAPGKRVLSYPDHLYNIRTGTVVGADRNHVHVDYEGYGRCTIKRRNGKLWNEYIDTSLDVQMIEDTQA